MTLTVVTMFKPSDAYKADPSIANPCLKMISALDGSLGGYHGIQMENNDIAYRIGFAKKIENFTAVRNNKKLWNQLLKVSAPTRIGDIEQYHLTTSSDPFKALSKPVADICMFTVREPVSENKRAIEAICKEWSEGSDELLTFGWTFENPNRGFVISSWDSVEAHLTFLKDPDVSSDLKRLSELIEAFLGHVRLTKGP